MVILSLCDGMSCGRMAFEKVGIPVESYYASEIKPIAIKATQHNFPDTIQIGDVNKVSYSNGILHTEKGDFKTNIDIVMFGSPCQSFSRAMKADRRIGLEDKVRSGLFLECYRVLQEIKPKYFLVENVIMEKENSDLISEMLGVQPIRINSSIVSAQMRDRLYWTNIPYNTPLQDKHISLNDILKDGYSPKEKAHCLCANDSHGYYNGCNWNPPTRFHRWWYKSFGTLIFKTEKDFKRALATAETIRGGRPSRAEYFSDYSGNAFDNMRYLYKEERAKLQTVPCNYVECMTEKEAADLLGDGWTVDVIAHLLKGCI